MSTVLTDDQTRQNIAEAVQFGLDARGWSQTKLAEMIGENRMTISRIVRNNVMPSAGIVGRIAEAFGVSVDWLYMSSADREARRFRKNRKSA